MNSTCSRSKTYEITLLNTLNFHVRCCGSQKYKETSEGGNGTSRLLSITVPMKYPGLKIPKLLFTERLDGTRERLFSICPVPFPQNICYWILRDSALFISLCSVCITILTFKMQSNLIIKGESSSKLRSGMQQ